MEDMIKIIEDKIKNNKDIIDIGYSNGFKMALIKANDNKYVIVHGFDMIDGKLDFIMLKTYESKFKAFNCFKSMKKTPYLNIKLIGIDSFDRPVYKSDKGVIYKDINLGKGVISLCTVLNNDFDGEPYRPLNNVIIKIVNEFKNKKDREAR